MSHKIKLEPCLFFGGGEICLPMCVYISIYLFNVSNCDGT